jgi:ABC-type transport system involved in cytochrome c biogenesis ATPase subunit
VLFDEAGERHNVGEVKIGQFEMPKGQRRPALPATTFNSLDASFFSLGQDDSYYETLAKLSLEMRDNVLSALHDIAASPELWERARNERVTQMSLLRSVTEKSVQGQFRRLLHGGVRLSSYHFAYTPPKRPSGPPSIIFTFDVLPESSPPTNVHVLTGRNGAGKTHMLNLMTRSLLAEDTPIRQFGHFSSEDPGGSVPFANVVSVSFSAFDEFELLPDRRGKSLKLQYSYVGLRRTTDTGPGIGTPKSTDMLTREFGKSVQLCLIGARASRWRNALEKLEADPIFKEADISALASEGVSDEFERRFRKLSSGHKIVLLTITRLVETVEERTLVLIDEPEAHLHPPLLSAFVRSLSDLLIDRNGVAIIATHSPVVVQEVPKNCVWKMRRAGEVVVIERPEIETFGENVGALTREVFGLEVTVTGFHKMLVEEVERGGIYEAILSAFGNELGAEARAIVRALVAARNAGPQG